MNAKDICGVERPARKTLCQLEKGHEGSHRAVIFWEGEATDFPYERIGWVSNLTDFASQMGEIIGGNMMEKGYSWREEGQSMELFLTQKLHEYIDAGKWVDVANIAFMLWERKRVVDEQTEKLNCAVCPAEEICAGGVLVGSEKCKQNRKTKGATE